MARVGLILAPRWDSRWPALGPALLSAVLRRAGHEVEVHDLDGAGRARGQAFETWSDPARFAAEILPAFDSRVDTWVDAVLAASPEVVGFTCYFSNRLMSAELARRLKARAPEVKTVAGGADLEVASCLAFYEAEPAFDALVRGEAEAALPALVAALARGRSAPRVAPPAPPLDLEALPFADFSGFRLDAYEGLTVSSNRGCVRRCNFCSDWRERPYRQRSAQRVFAEIEHQLGLHPDKSRFMFGDSLVNGVPKELRGLAGRLAAAGAPAAWIGYAIVRREMDRAMGGLLRRAGCETLMFGLESGSSDVLRSMDKPVDPALAARVLRDTADAGVGVQVSWIVGYPTETREAFETSLRFIRENAGAIDHLMINPFSAVHTWDRAAELGLSAPGHDRYWVSRDGKNHFAERVARAERTVEAALSGGTTVYFESSEPVTDFAPLKAQMLASYEDWKTTALAV